MNKILIVSKTRMTSSSVCVGGVDLDNRQSVRLLYWNGRLESLYECPYNIRDIWEMDYRKDIQSPLPHSEDVSVIARKITGRLDRSIRFLDLLRQIGFRVYQDDIRNAFEGKLQTTESGIFYISPKAIPFNSTCFWLCDRELWRNEVQGKVRYRYNDGTHNWGHNIMYVGIEQATPALIPQNTLLRLSLARWWAPDHRRDEERCYLQFSGWYDLNPTAQ